MIKCRTESECNENLQKYILHDSYQIHKASSTVYQISTAQVPTRMKKKKKVLCE
jgi:hypothetical protein